MTPEQRADILWSKSFARDDSSDLVRIAPEYFRQEVAASIRAAEKTVWQEAGRHYFGKSEGRMADDRLMHVYKDIMAVAIHAAILAAEKAVREKTEGGTEARPPSCE